MKSTVEVGPNLGGWVTSVEILMGVVKEFEEFTGGGYQYTIDSYCGDQIKLVAKMFDPTAPLVVVDTNGNLGLCCMRNRVGLCGFQINPFKLDRKIYFKSWRGLVTASGVKQDIERSMDIDDIFNIQPHEYGLLKLKWGIEKRELFIPTVAKEYIKGLKL